MMKVTLIDKEGFLVEPETDFESQWLGRLGWEDKCDLEAFHKNGISTGDYMGIKIRVKQKKLNNL
jgi:ABC-type antimicrobial peptide transport system ATPase subunit